MGRLYTCGRRGKHQVIINIIEISRGGLRRPADSNHMREGPGDWSGLQAGASSSEQLGQDWRVTPGYPDLREGRTLYRVPIESGKPGK